MLKCIQFIVYPFTKCVSCCPLLCSFSLGTRNCNAVYLKRIAHLAPNVSHGICWICTCTRWILCVCVIPCRRSYLYLVGAETQKMERSSSVRPSPKSFQAKSSKCIYLNIPGQCFFSAGGRIQTAKVSQGKTGFLKPPQHLRQALGWLATRVKHRCGSVMQFQKCGMAWCGAASKIVFRISVGARTKTIWHAERLIIRQE